MNDLFRGTPTLAASMLGYVEVAATLSRRGHPNAVPDLRARLLADWSGLLKVELTAAILDRASVFAWTHKLKGADAIHLASAQYVFNAAMGRSLLFAFATADLELERAARDIGMAVLNPLERI